MKNMAFMYLDSEFIPTAEEESGIRFMYRKGNGPIEHIDNPDVDWLLNFMDQYGDTCYFVPNAQDWWKAFECAVAHEAKPLIMNALREREVLSNNDIYSIIKSVIEKHDPSMAKMILISVDQYLSYIDINAEQVWRWRDDSKPSCDPPVRHPWKKRRYQDDYGYLTEEGKKIFFGRGNEEKGNET